MKKTTQKTTILQIIPNLTIGGVQGHTLELHEGFCRRGIQSLILADEGPLTPLAEKMGGEIYTHPIGSKNPLDFYKNKKKVEEILHRHAVDAILVGSRAPAWTLALGGFYKKLPIIGTYHGVYGHQNQLKRYYNQIMLRGPKTIAVSQYVAKHIQQIYPEALGKTELHTIPQGVDTTFYNPEKFTELDIQETRISWGVGKTQKVILVPGRIRPIKGQDLIVEAALNLPKFEQQTLKIIFLGPHDPQCPYTSKLLEKVKASPSLFHYSSGSENMPLSYASADGVLQYSTKPESFGRVVIEGMAMEKPIILADQGPAREILTAKEGFLTTPRTPRQLSELLSFFMTLPEDRLKTLGKRGRDRVKRLYSLEKNIEKTLFVLQESIRQWHHKQASAPRP